MPSDTWINGENVTSEINQLCQIDFGSENELSYSCKSKQNAGQDQQGINYYQYPRKPLPQPNINHYAVLEKPGVNRKVMRGCFQTPQDPELPLWKVNEIVTDEQGQPVTNAQGEPIRTNTPMIQICDDYKGAYCSNPYIQNKYCKTDAPGGLADFTHPMRAVGEDFLDNGFILDRCECSLNINSFEDRPLDSGCAVLTSNVGDQPVDYVCKKDKRYDTCTKDFLVTEVKRSCCEPDVHWRCMNKGYTIENPSKITSRNEWILPGESACHGGDFRNKDFSQYMPSELWDGRIKERNAITDDEFHKCHYWYNPTIDELPIGNKDKNNCTQYLLKWAHSCKWCKENRIGSGDGGELCHEGTNGCPVSRKCAGSCDKPFFTSEDDPRRVCSWSMDTECNICESPLWEHIPGGWEALVDKDHPQHKMALFSYVPKLLKFDNNNQPTTMLQPDGKPSDPHVENRDSNDGAKGVTSFVGLGPYVDEAITDRERGYNDFLSNQINSISFNQEYNWVGNTNIDHKGLPEKEHPRCSVTDPNAITTDNRSMWDSSFLASYRNSTSTINGALETCDYRNPTISPEQNPRAHVICERNPNLTGYGECDEDTDYYAKLWLEGKWDLSKYTGDTELIDEGLTQEELNQRRLEGLRCCLGLTPDFISTETNGIEIPSDIQYNIQGMEKEYKRYKYCRPGLTCPSSNACKELFKKFMTLEWRTPSGGFSMYNFGAAYPENYSLQGNEETPKSIMEDPSYYVKAYCEMNAGGAGGVSSSYNDCARDRETEIDCRKLMYNYCSTPVQTDLQGELDDLNVSTIEYPLRIFTDSCYEWCRESNFGRSLTKSLPSQKGVCDMAVAKTCQQLQVDGWLDPDNWAGSKILEFADDQGVWYENGRPHQGLTAERLRNVCGCFLLGSECGDGNCSVTYCGAGTNGEKGPGPVPIDIDWGPDDYNEDNKVNKTIFDMNYVYDFQGPRVADKWEENIDPQEFKCTSQGSNVEDNRCFKGCNYVNFNDTCWMASPEERLHDTLEEFKDINVWECDGDKTVGDNCGTYNGKYGCFGNCNTNYLIGTDVRGMCGTDEWFEHEMGINPNEKKYKSLKKFYNENQELVGDIKPNRSRNWPKWQNYYSEKRNIPGVFQPKQSNTQVQVPGWGSYVTDSNGLPKKYGSVEEPVCFYPPCANKDSIRPYREMVKGNTTCGNNCSIELGTTINNQGLIVGSITSSLNASNSCNLEFNDWKPDALVSSDNQREYISLMGDNDCSDLLKNIKNNNIDCSTCSLDSTSNSCRQCNDLLECVHGSKVCIDAESGDNCQLCQNEKSQICCLSPNENPYPQGSMENISWNEENKYLLRNTSNYVSYICEKECPNGSVPLADLMERCGGGGCSNRDRTNCEDCAYCTWVPENIETGREAHCSPMCPLPPSVGWGIQIPPRGTNPAQPEPSVAPIVITTEAPGPVGNVDGGGGGVLVVVVSSVIGLLVVGAIVFIIIKSKIKKP